MKKMRKRVVRIISKMKNNKMINKSNNNRIKQCNN